MKLVSKDKNRLFVTNNGIAQNLGKLEKWKVLYTTALTGSYSTPQDIHEYSIENVKRLLILI